MGSFVGFLVLCPNTVDIFGRRGLWGSPRGGGPGPRNLASDVWSAWLPRAPGGP